MKKNILIITIDGARPDHFTYNGYNRSTTPNIDSLASQGTIFQNAHSTSNSTNGGHASLLSGLYPTSHGSLGPTSISPEVPLLTEILLEKGYDTVSFQNSPHSGELYGLDGGFQESFDLWRYKHEGNVLNKFYKKILKKTGYFDSGARNTYKKVSKWLGTRDRERPFFMLIHMNDTHHFYNPPHPYKYMFMDRKQKRLIRNSRTQLADFLSFYNEEVDKYIVSPEIREIFINLYDAALFYVDYWLGKLFQEIDKLGHLDDTIVVITSDHGESFGEHDLLGHGGTLYQNIIRVPLIIFSKSLPKGKIVKSLVSLIDVVPTLLSLIGAEKGKHFFDGSSLLPPQKEYHEFIIAEQDKMIPNSTPERFYRRAARAIITKDHFKLINYSDGNSELFDLKNDPNENRNTHDQEKDIVELLEQKLVTLYKSMESRVSDDLHNPDLDEDVRKELEILGYVSNN